MDKLLTTLGLCRRAGRLEWGNDAVADAVAAGRAALVLLAADLSGKSARQVRFVCEQNGVPVHDTPVTMDEIWYRLGKRTGILAVTDRGLSHTILKQLEERRAR